MKLKPAHHTINHERRHLILAGCSLLSASSLGLSLSSCSNRPEPETSTRILVPEGFTPRILARSGFSPLPDSDEVWHSGPDGGGTLALDDGGWLYVSNGETSNGCVGVLRFDAEGTVIDHYHILQGSSHNCSGTMTPWNSWLSCEEIPLGVVWECDPLGQNPAVQRPALGLFKHESACVNPNTFQIYLTEDEKDGRFYRFTPENPAAPHDALLENGLLEVAKVENNLVNWIPVNDPSASSKSTRYQVKSSTSFNGGEGVVYTSNGMIYFTTKGDNCIWLYDPATEQLLERYNATGYIDSVDDIIEISSSDLLVAEDGPNMRLTCFDSNDSDPFYFLRLPDHYRSEITGLALDPSETRLYFSSQKGNTGSRRDGVTFELVGNFTSDNLSAPLVEFILT